MQSSVQRPTLTTGTKGRVRTRADQTAREYVSDWITNAQYAAYRNIAIATQNKERVRGDGPPFLKRKRLIRYSRRAVDEWNLLQMRGSTSEAPSKPPMPILPQQPRTVAPCRTPSARGDGADW